MPWSPDDERIVGIAVRIADHLCALDADGFPYESLVRALGKAFEAESPAAIKVASRDLVVAIENDAAELLGALDGPGNAQLHLLSEAPIETKRPEAYARGCYAITRVRREILGRRPPRRPTCATRSRQSRSRARERRGRASRATRAGPSDDGPPGEPPGEGWLRDHRDVERHVGVRR